MLTKTHIPIGVASALLAQPPTTIPMLGNAILVSAIGGAICDIDSSHSKAKKNFDKFVGVLFVSILTVSGIDYFWDVGLRNYIFENDSITKMMCAVFMLALICFYGSGQPHRGFMHSFACCFMITAIVASLIPSIYIYFCVAYLSHIAVDLLNKKGEQILWPLKWKMGLYICKSDGFLNDILFVAGIVASAYAITNCPPVKEIISTLPK